MPHRINYKRQVYFLLDDKVGMDTRISAVQYQARIFNRNVVMPVTGGLYGKKEK